MKQGVKMAARIRAMEPGEQFVVATDRERVAALNIGRILYSSGAVAFRLHTKRLGSGGYRVEAMRED